MRIANAAEISAKPIGARLFSAADIDRGMQRQMI
jgi:hypothetical protein